MRIIAGKYRGRKIKMPKGKGVRPTQDRVREAIFNVIRESLPGSKVLDLYAGSGAFGIEALSRGASLSIFVDNNINCISAIRYNLGQLEIGKQNSQVLKKEAVTAISELNNKSTTFDIIFMDPPYHKGLARNTLIKIDSCDILSGRGLVVLEHFAKDDMPERAESLVRFKQKRYGDTVVSYYRKK